MRTSVKIAGGSVAVLVFIGSLLPDDRKQTTSGQSISVEATTAPSGLAPAAVKAPGTAAVALLYAASGGDGDSWKDTSGREYRLGLVNTPERGECFGAQAAEARQSLVAEGFRVDVYATDSYGRGVSVVTLADGRNLNVLLARNGYADDRFLAKFRSENPSLAKQLDSAFAAAKAERAGLWAACNAPANGAGSTPKPAAAPAPRGDCHPAYKTCIPVKGDGSGDGAGNDLDCGEIGKVVYLQQIGNDPYRLDGEDNDGVGCESYP